jgi:hypothetical protein
MLYHTIALVNEGDNNTPEVYYSGDVRLVSGGRKNGR